MNRKEFLAVVISAALGLSGAPVYASESAAFSLSFLICRSSGNNHCIICDPSGPPRINNWSV